MSQFAGVDIGQGHTYSCVLDTETLVFIYPDDSMDLEETVKWLRGFDKLSGACIDGPPNPNTGQLRKSLPPGTTHNVDRRVTEFKIGIGGCYSTRSESPLQGATNYWMLSAFDCFHMLSEEYGWSVDKGTGEGRLIETHPSYAFKALLGCTRRVEEGIERLRLDPQALLRPKHSELGHRQRFALLTEICNENGFVPTEEVLQKWNQRIDWADAAICAFMSHWQQLGHADLEAPGDVEEGAIYLRIRKKTGEESTGSGLSLRSLLRVVDRVADNSSGQSKTRSSGKRASKKRLSLAGVQTPANAIILRLGDTPALTQKRTLEIVLSHLDSEDFWFPCGSNASFSLCSNLKSVSGRLFLAWGTDLRIALVIDDCEDVTEPIAYPGKNPSPWPVPHCRRWLRVRDACEINSDEFYVVQSGVWKRGFGDGQGALLWAVVPNNEGQS